MKQCFGKAHEDRLIPLMGRKRRRALSLPVPNYVVKLHCLVGLSPTPLPIAVIQDGTVLKQMDQPTSPAANPFRHSGSPGGAFFRPLITRRHHRSQSRRVAGLHTNVTSRRRESACLLPGFCSRESYL